MNRVEARSYFESLGETALIAVLVATPVMMNVVMNRGYEVSKLALAEPLVFLALCAGLFAGFRGRVGGLRDAASAAYVALAIFLIIGAVSTAFSATPEIAFFGSYFRREGMLAWAAYAALFCSLSAISRCEHRSERVVDALLLSSVIPCSYAIQQSYGLDFHHIANFDFTRLSGTLGNPIFLAAYLALLIPIAMERCWYERRRIGRLWLWLLLVSLQFFTLIMTQTRGPLLALLGGLALFSIFIAVQLHARRILLVGVACLVTGLSGLAILNIVPSVARLAENLPVVSRFVFSLDNAASSATLLASRSASTRLDIWQAGTVAWIKAPIGNKLLGYGPESAYVHYFPHMPESVMRKDGFLEANTYDRLHADALDIGLNFGILGWLAYLVFFCAVMYSAARALFGLTGIEPVWIFLAFVVWSGVFSAAAAIQLGLYSAAGPAFALGVGAGWFGFFLGCSWRALSRKASLPEALSGGRWLLLASLVCSLLIFWIDAQVNIPVMTTRLTSFGIAALILAISDSRLSKRAHVLAFSGHLRRDNRAEGVAWVVAFGLIAACASFLSSAYGPTSVGQWGFMIFARLIPMVSLLVVGAYAAWIFRAESVAPRELRVWRLASIALCPPALYTGLHYALAVDVGVGVGFEQVQKMVLISVAGPCFIFALCIVRPLISEQGLSAADGGGQLRKRELTFAAASTVAVILAAYAAWLAIAADVAAMAAGLNYGRGKHDRAEALYRRAVQLMPYERNYRREWMALPISDAIQAINSRGRGGAADEALAGNIALGEARARENLARWPNDPWSVFSLAGALRLRALTELRTTDPAAGKMASDEARSLFLRAHQMFPTQPLYLRDWARFEFDEGSLNDAVQLLERMESIIPEASDPYIERVVMARKLNDSGDVAATLGRAKLRLQPLEYRKVESVAK